MPILKGLSGRLQELHFTSLPQCPVVAVHVSIDFLAASIIVYMYEIKKLGINGKFKTTSHCTIMEQLQIKVDQFRKQGRLQDQDLEEIISAIKADEEFKDGEETSKAETASKDKQKRVLEVVKEVYCKFTG